MPFWRNDVWDDSSLRKLHRTDLIRAWFSDVDRIDGPGMVLMSWETRMPAEEWWEMILEMVRLAPDERCLGSVAAGPFEHLLALYGTELVDRIENESICNDRLVVTIKNLGNHHQC